MDAPPDLPPDLAASWLAARLTDPGMRGIARGVCDLIRRGEVAVGTRLPPVRELALALGVSPATVSAAWTELRRLNLVAGRGRNGLRVSGRRAGPHPLRFTSTGRFLDGVLDLTLAVPDPALLPPLAPALARAGAAEGLNQYERIAILPHLEQVLRRDWPCPAQAFLAVDGGYDGVRVALRALLLPGSRVAVEVPTALRLLDIVEESGAVVVPVACDAEGPRPDSLAEALVQRVAAFLFQPRTHSVTGLTRSRARLDALADLLLGHDVLVIEDDGLGDLSPVPAQSLGSVLGGQVVHIRSFSKPYGPDLRLAAVSATREAVERMQGVRAFGGGWTSRLLQETAALLLEDPATEPMLVRARQVYARRRLALCTALAARGIGAGLAGEGLCVWLPVREESFALVSFAAHNIAVMPGSKCAPVPIAPHVRIATSLLRAHYEEVAEVAAMVHPGVRPGTLAAGGG